MGTYTALSSRHKTQILQLIEQALRQSTKLFPLSLVDTRRSLLRNYRSHLVRRKIDFLSWQELERRALYKVVESIGP